MVDRIQDIGFEPDEGIKIILYGESGSGKTTLWATFPEPILAIVCSGGFKPGELRSVNTKANRQRIKQVTLQHSTELLELTDHVAATGTWGTVVLDHVSGLQDLTLKEVLGLDKLPAQKNYGLASMQDYGQSTQQCKEGLRGLLNLSCNVVIIGQERVFNAAEDGGGDSDIIRPTVSVGVSKSLREWLCPAVDYALQTFKRPRMVAKVKEVAGKKKTVMVRAQGIEYCVRCEPHETYYTKFRVPKGSKMPDVIVDPDYSKIMDVLNAADQETLE